MQIMNMSNTWKGIGLDKQALLNLPKEELKQLQKSLKKHHELIGTEYTDKRMKAINYLIKEKE